MKPTDWESNKPIELSAYESAYSSDSTSQIRNSYFLADSNQRFLALLKQLCPGKRVIEIGCGRGELSIQAASWGAVSVIGIDFSPTAIAFANQLAKSNNLSNRVSFINADLCRLSFEPNTFDLIIDQEVFSSLEIIKILPLIVSWLSPNGMILGIECLAHNPVFNLNRKISALLGRRTKWAATHILTNSDLDLIRSFFKDLEVSYHHLFSILGAPMAWLLPDTIQRKMANIYKQIDKLILQGSPRDLAFKVVFHGTKRK